MNKKEKKKSDLKKSHLNKIVENKQEILEVSEELKISKYKKRILITIMIILIAIVLISISWILLKTKLLIDEDIIIKTDITYSSKNLKHGQSANITITANVKAAIMCESQCTTTLKKIDTNEISYSNIEIIKNSRDLKTTLEITANKLGYGQELYSYQISCFNLYSNICPAPDSTVEKNALISINYEPNELQLQAKGELEKALTQTFTNLITVSNTLNQNEEYLKQTSLIENNSLRITNEELKTAHTTYLKFVEDLNTEEILDYVHIKQKIDSANILSRTSLLLNQTSKLNLEIKETAEFHNTAITKLEQVFREKLLLEQMLTTTRINELSNQTNTTEKYEEIKDNINSIILKLNNNTVTNYQEIISEIDNSLSLIQMLKDQYSEKFNYNHIILLTKLNIFETSICITGTSITDCKNFSRINTSLSNKSLTTQINMNTDYCKELIKTTNKYDEVKIMQIIKRAEISSSDLLEIDKEKAFIDYSIITQIIQKLTLDRLLIKEIVQLKELKANELLTKYNTLPPPQLNYYPEFYNSTKAKLSLPLNADEETDLTHLSELCGFENVNITMNFFNLYKEKINMQPEITIMESEYRLKDIKPVCCAYNNCHVCLDENKDNNSRNPLLLIHGHSFYIKHTPDYSTNIFSSLQKKLEEDQLYIPGATLTSDKQPYLLEKQEFGKNPVPLVAKGTYYYVSLFDGNNYIPKISKSENIDTYAIRLKEVVDEMKYMTGKEKIDVVAHSMGGLVLMRYMQLFGEESIDKIILVGTPAQGINDRMHNFCKLLGYTKECDDMHQGSAIIRTINDPNRTINPQKINTIIGTGCAMDNGEDGDGIVTKNSATIQNANNNIINGTCPIIDFPLHNDMLYPEKYPESYEIIKQILTN